MTWTIEFLPKLKRELKKLQKEDILALFQYLEDEIIPLNDPREAPGVKHLQGSLKDYWRFRVGDFRIVVEIKDEKLIVLVVRIAVRKDAYKQKVQLKKEPSIISFSDLKKKIIK